MGKMHGGIAGLQLERGLEFIAALSDALFLFGADSLLLHGHGQAVMKAGPLLIGGGLRQRLAENVLGILVGADFVGYGLRTAQALGTMAAILLVCLAEGVHGNTLVAMLEPVDSFSEGFFGLRVGGTPRFGASVLSASMAYRQGPNMNSKTRKAKHFRWSGLEILRTCALSPSFF